MLKIVSVALKQEDLVFSMPSPHRHHHVINYLFNLGFPKSLHREQGFLTSEGIFVNRTEARLIALAAGQTTETHLDTELISEDLW